MQSISANLNIMIKAAEKASRALIRDFGEIEKLQVSIKGPSDFVSNADLKAEKIIIEELKKARPYYSIISEEDGSEKNKALLQDYANKFIVRGLSGKLFTRSDVKLIFQDLLVNWVGKTDWIPKTFEKFLLDLPCRQDASLGVYHYPGTITENLFSTDK